MLSTEQTNPRKIRVMLVDDSAILLREAIRFLHGHPRVEIVGSVSVAANAAAHAHLHIPDVVLLDITTRGVQSIPVIREVHTICPAVPIIVLDEIEIESVKHAAIAGGAAAFVTKKTADTELLPAILAVVRPGDINA